jgi:hypothetical protein
MRIQVTSSDRDHRFCIGGCAIVVEAGAAGHVDVRATFRMPATVGML